MIKGIALLAGLFVFPALLLITGHHLRRRDARTRHRFWGGVLGYLVGLLIATAAMLAPPVWWEGGSAVRNLLVYWSMTAGFLGGTAVGSFVRVRVNGG